MCLTWSGKYYKALSHVYSYILHSHLPHALCTASIFSMSVVHNKCDCNTKQVYIEKKNISMIACFTNLSEDKSIPMTALWCPAFSNHG